MSKHSRAQHEERKAEATPAPAAPIAPEAPAAPTASVALQGEALHFPTSEDVDFVVTRAAFSGVQAMSVALPPGEGWTLAGFAMNDVAAAWTWTRPKPVTSA